MAGRMMTDNSLCSITLKVSDCFEPGSESK